MKTARAEEMTDDDSTFALRRKDLQSIDAAFLADCGVAGAEIARQHKPSWRFAIVAKQDIEREIFQRRPAETHFIKVDLRGGSTTSGFSKVFYEQCPIVLVAGNGCSKSN